MWYFDGLIERRWGGAITPPKQSAWDTYKDWEEYEDGYEEVCNIPDTENIVDSTGRILNSQPAHDKLINAELHLQQDGNIQTAKVVCRREVPDGWNIGSYNKNPSLNSII